METPTEGSAEPEMPPPPPDEGTAIEETPVSEAPPTGGGWSWRDTLALTLITAIVGVLRLVRLDLPKTIIFDETYYAKDACWYVNVSEKICEIGYEQTYVHPPLAKWLIAIGIRLFGWDSFGWRSPSLSPERSPSRSSTSSLVGSSARHWGPSSPPASWRSTYSTSSSPGPRCSTYSRRCSGWLRCCSCCTTATRFRPPPGTRGAHGVLDRPWRLAAGACGGAAAACKWPGAFYLVLVIVLTVVWEIAQRRTDGAPHPIARFLREETVTIFFWLIVFPVLFYMFTYVGRIEGGAFLANPTSAESWFRMFWDRQWSMLDFHLHLESSHGYQSNPETWMLLKRPVSYHIEYGPNGEYSEVMATGSPFVWWASILSFVYVFFRWVGARIRKRTYEGVLRWRPEGLIVAGYFFTYGPWLIPTDRPATFIFYLLPTIPFMCLALAFVATEIGRTWEAKAAIALFAAGSIGFFAFYYPIVAGVEIPKESWDRRIWEFDACDKPGGTPTKATVTTTTCGKTKTTVQDTTSNSELPPIGWCWI